MESQKQRHAEDDGTAQCIFKREMGMIQIDVGKISIGMDIRET